MYTVRNAVGDVLASYPKGTDFHGRDFCKACQDLLNAHATHLWPMEDTFLRNLREVKSKYNVIVKNRDQSLYHVMSDEEIEQRNQESGQQSLF